MGRKKSIQRFKSNEIILNETAKTHSIHSTKNEPQCQLWTFSGDNIKQDRFADFNKRTSLREKIALSLRPAWAAYIISLRPV